MFNKQVSTGIATGLLVVILAGVSWHYVVGPMWYYARVLSLIEKDLKFRQNHGQEFVR